MRQRNVTVLSIGLLLLLAISYYLSHKARTPPLHANSQNDAGRYWTHGQRPKHPHKPYEPHRQQQQQQQQQAQHSQDQSQQYQHPIDELVTRAAQEHEARLSQQTENLTQAATAYRTRRGRHPPPKFDEWVHFCKQNNVFMVEEFFDQIYDDLRPFWGLPAEEIRQASQIHECVISVRNGKAVARTEVDPRPLHLSVYLDMIEKIQQFLPDVDIPINPHDMPHVIASWEEIEELIEYGKDSLQIPAPPQVISTYTNLSSLPDEVPKYETTLWQSNTTYWANAREACPPGSEARTAELATEWSLEDLFPRGQPASSHHGYVSNWTEAKSVCHHPHLRNLHGSLIRPTRDNVATWLLPLFSGSKMQGINNDILLPSSFYWQDEPAYNGDEFPRRTRWDEKAERVYWRGQASGGKHNATNWKGFHRQRFIAMMNASMLAAEADGDLASAAPHLYPVPKAEDGWDLGVYSAPASSSLGSALASWISPFADAALTHFLCDPWFLAMFRPAGECEYMEPWFQVKAKSPPSEQFAAKYIPDIDGHGWSARYRGFLRSESLPIKATLFAEWHDTRLTAWKHFVPMDNTFVDFWGIMDYFLGFTPVASPNQDPGAAMPQSKPGHDQRAQSIALEGSLWAEQVLRKEDMLAYVYRLLLEYARLCDDYRDMMGYAGDLP